MVISVNQGMGKTTVLDEISEILKDDNYKVFYGDCDEFQDSDRDTLLTISAGI